MSDNASPTVERLDEATVDRIAAGEVITRPARVVGELLDNALDADADSIRVEVDGDGTERIRVADDGHGMSRRDAARAIERHATSKLRDAADLPATTSLGFRGEALPSIADAGRLELVTSDGTEPGTRLVVDSAGDIEITDAGRARGTTVTVRDLFADRPARLEALGGAGAEFAKVSELVARYALARPDVSFSLAHDDRELFETPGSGAYEDALAAVYDRHVAARSTTFSHETTLSGDDSAGSTLHVEGVLAFPSTTRSDRSHLRTAINGRPVVDEGIRRAVERGYGTLLPDGRHPVAVVTVSLPPETVDANVHPAKAEVALSARDAVEAAVETGVNDALTTADLRRSGEVAMGLDESIAPESGDSVLADADVLGQFRETYLLCEANDLLVIDQHAAHERVNFERLQAAIAGEAIERAELSPPETVSLSPAEAAVVEERAADLSAMGFDAEPFGGTTVKLSAVPAPLGRPADSGAFRETLATLARGDAPEDAREDALAELACHPSLKAGDVLENEAAQALVDRLGQCEQPFACPHGRPTVLSVSEETLAAGFERQ